jgi:hypothetical protein
MNWKKLVGTWGIAMVVGLYTTFVLQTLWNWFAVQALNAPAVSYWAMYGLMMLIHLVFEKPPFEMDKKFKLISIVVDACVPDDKRHDVNELLKQEEEGLVPELMGMIGGQAFGNTFTLGLGWAIHQFLS